MTKFTRLKYSFDKKIKSQFYTKNKRIIKWATKIASIRILLFFACRMKHDDMANGYYKGGGN